MNVVFEEDNLARPRLLSRQKIGPVASLVIKLSGGRINQEATIAKVLLGISVLALLATLVVIRSYVIPPAPEPILSPYDG
jgi:hypothetical protein